jgi:hypothetical protein
MCTRTQLLGSIYLSYARIHTRISISLIGTNMHAQLYVFIFLVLSYTHRHKHMAVSLTQARAHTHFLCRSMIHKQSLAYMHALAVTSTYMHTGTWAGQGGSAHGHRHTYSTLVRLGHCASPAPTCLAPSSPMLLLARLACGPPPSQSHTETQTKRKREATQGTTRKGKRACG